MATELFDIAREMYDVAQESGADSLRTTLGNCGKLDGWNLTIIVHQDDWDDFLDAELADRS